MTTRTTTSTTRSSEREGWLTTHAPRPRVAVATHSYTSAPPVWQSVQRVNSSTVSQSFGVHERLSLIEVRFQLDGVLPLREDDVTPVAIREDRLALVVHHHVVVTAEATE